MKMTERQDPPVGIRRLLFRAPIHLFRWHLGWVLGHRFLMLNHVGRKSGKHRQVVLEVVNHDNVAEGYVIAAGFGATSDWYRNLQKNPDVTIEVGGKTVAVRAEQLAADTGAAFMAHYGASHPKLGARLCKVMGFEVDGTPEDFREVGARVHFVRLVPTVSPL